MERQAVLAVVVATLLAAMSLASSATPIANGAPTTVRCGADDLQSAIDNAATGATLRIRGTCVGSFTISRDLTLRGLRGATLQGNEGTVVTIAGGASVVLSDMTLTGGKANILLPVEKRVGGIYNAGALTLEGTTTVAKNGFNCGVNPPALPQCDPGRPIRTDLTGGVINVGNLVLTGHASISENPRGVSNYGSMTMRGQSSVENNSTSLPGAGIVNHGEIIMEDRASIRGNSSTWIVGYAGGLYNRRGATFTMNNRSSIHDNSAEQIGGGVVNHGTLALNDRASIRNNSAWEAGGIANSGSVVLDGRYSITTNAAGSSGGGIYNNDVEPVCSRGCGPKVPHGVVIGSLRGVVGNTPDDCYSDKLDGPCAQ